MSYVFVAAVSFWIGIGVAYLTTHKEFRGALFSKLHSTADELLTEIKAKLERKQQ